MFASIKNSSLVKFFVGLSLVISGSAIPINPAGAVDEPTPEPSVSVEVVQPEVVQPEVTEPEAKFSSLLNRDIFSSQERYSPYSEEELEHEPITEAEIRGDSWESRVENCNSIADYDTYADCMFRPWVYGF